MITVSIDILTAENVGHDKCVNSFERGFHHVETRIILYIKLDKLFMYIIDNEILLTIHLIACNYVLLYTYYYLDARIESLRDTSGRLSYSQLKHVSRLEPSTKGAFGVSKHWHLRAIAFECRGYFRKNSVESIISAPLSYARAASNNS